MQSPQAWPRITLVTPCLDQASYLEAALRSVLDQEYPNLEYIVVDGGSTDGSREIVERYGRRLAHWVSEPDLGQADALNKGFARSSGEIMGWLNADDLLLPGSLRLVGSLFAEFPEVEWLTSRATSIDPLGRIVDSVPSRFWTRERLLSARDEFVQQESTFWRKELWERAGRCVSDDYVAFDFDLWARFSRSASLRRTRGAIGAFRMRPEQISRGQRDRYLSDVEEIASRERAGDEASPGSAVDSLLELALEPLSWRFQPAEPASSAGSGVRDVKLENERLQLLVDARQEAIDVLRLELEARAGVIERLETAIVALEQALAGKERAREAFESALRGRLEQLEAMHASASWRVTAPLRWIADRLSRAKPPPS